MSDTTFVDGSTLTSADWFNDINDFFYTTHTGQSGGGIRKVQFPATQVASTDVNALDDYEEGTYTPTPNANLTIVSDHAVLSYIKVGKLVTVLGQLKVNTVSGTDTVTFTLPFTAAAGPTNGFNRATGVCYYESVDVGTTGLIAEILDSGTTMGFELLNDNAAPAALTNAQLTANDVIRLNIQYIASA